MNSKSRARKFSMPGNWRGYKCRLTLIMNISDRRAFEWNSHSAKWLSWFCHRRSISAAGRKLRLERRARVRSGRSALWLINLNTNLGKQSYVCPAPYSARSRPLSLSFSSLRRISKWIKVYPRACAPVGRERKRDREPLVHSIPLLEANFCDFRATKGLPAIILPLCCILIIAGRAGQERGGDATDVR